MVTPTSAPSGEDGAGYALVEALQGQGHKPYRAGGCSPLLPPGARPWVR